MSGRTPRRLGAGLLAGALLLTPACLSVRASRVSLFEPVDLAVVRALEDEEADLGRALEALGAPIDVWEYRVHGVALAYGSFSNREWGVRLEVPVSDAASASFDYRDATEGLYGVVLFFDPDGALELVREGYLGELRPRRPSPEVVLEED